MSKPPTVPTIRTFVAVELSPNVQSSLSAVETEFGKQAASIKWVPVDLLHITVRFLGAVAASRIAEVYRATRQAAATVAPFTLFIDHLGAFPSERRPRVLWAGLRADEGYANLGSLFVALDLVLADRGFPSENRKYSPHITLARVRQGARKEDEEHLGQTFAAVRGRLHPEGSISVNQLTVMRSDLSPTGPRYTPLFRAELAGVH